MNGGSVKRLAVSATRKPPFVSAVVVWPSSIREQAMRNAPTVP